MEIEELLKLLMDRGASDLHLRVGTPPVLRIDGRLVLLDDLPPVTDDDVLRMLEQITTQEQRDTFFRDKELDFAYALGQLVRFRFNVMWQRKTISIACRVVPFEVP